MTEFGRIVGIGGQNVTPNRVEADIRFLEVAGEVPKALNGVYYKAGPDHALPPFIKEDIVINGDGMVTMFHFDDGAVHFKSRYVHTERYMLEQQAGQKLYGAYRNPYTDIGEARGKSRGTANTHVVFHGGKLLALREDSLPVELDPWSLKTIGPWNYGGRIESPVMTAHPKFDPVTGEMWAFAYFAKDAMPSRDMVVYAIDRDGKLARQEWFQAPYQGLLHDFAVSRNYVIFPVMPVISDNEWLPRGDPFYKQDLSRPTMVGVMPRDGSAKDMRWFQATNCFGAHIMNAFDEGGKVHVDMCISDRSTFAFFPNIDGTPHDPSHQIPRLTRMTFDMTGNSDRLKKTLLYHYVNEMPKIDDRYQLERNRYGFMQGVDMAARREGPGSTLLVKFDHDKGSSLDWDPGPGCGASEPFFVPRREGAAEADGYVLTVVSRRLEGRSDLAIIDTATMQPVAMVKLPYMLQGAFHGSWVPQSVLPPMA